jgi:hypothetical protein
MMKPFWQEPLFVSFMRLYANSIPSAQNIYHHVFCKALPSQIFQGFIFQIFTSYCLLRHCNITIAGRQAYYNFHQISSRLINLNHGTSAPRNKNKEQNVPSLLERLLLALPKRNLITSLFLVIGNGEPVCRFECEIVWYHLKLTSIYRAVLNSFITQDLINYAFWTIEVTQRIILHAGMTRFVW